MTEALIVAAGMFVAGGLIGWAIGVRWVKHFERAISDGTPVEVQGSWVFLHTSPAVRKEGVSDE